MPTFPFKRAPSSRPSSVESPDRPTKWPPDGDSKERAVARLLQYGVLSHIVGRGMEYQVRTTLVTQRLWHYRCEVLCHDKPMKWAFSPIAVDRTSQIRHLDPAPESIKAVRLNLAEEAVGVHFTRCAVLREYLTLASIYAQPPQATPRRSRRSVFLVGVALLMAYGLWTLTPKLHSTPPPVGSPAVTQQATQPVVAPILPPAPEPIPVPPANNAFSAKLPTKPSAAVEATPVDTAPKQVLLSDLLSLGSAVENAVPASPSEATGRQTEGDVQPGNLLLFTGWLHWISRTPNGTYQLYVTPSPRSKTPGLIAAVPPPDQPARPPALEKQLQAVRSFITQRLLRQQKPSTRRFVMRKPIFIQLMGQWSPPNDSLAEPAGGKPGEAATAGWGVHPLLQVQFATPPPSPSRSPSR
jgi:hypothetical protein